MLFKNALVGVVFLAFGLLAFGIVGHSFATHGFPPPQLTMLVVLIFGAVGTACSLAGAKTLRDVAVTIQSYRAELANSISKGSTIKPLNPFAFQPKYSPPADMPWLKRQEWRERTILHGNPVGNVVLLFAFFVFGSIALLFLWLAITPSAKAADRIDGVLWGSLMIFILVALTYWRLRYRRYGDSVCRLITLPGIVGGWFKADVECTLPDDSTEPIIVRLKNFGNSGSKHPKVVWQMEKGIASPVSHGSRTTVRVRLRIPRHPTQRPNSASDNKFFATVPSWILEVEKKAAGVDYFARFHVPIYDTPLAPSSEQQAE